MDLFNKQSYIFSRLRSVFFTLFNRLENNNNADFYYNGEFRFLQQYVQQLSGSAVFFDVGANIGGYTEILLRESLRCNLRCQIHLFEPTQYCFAELKKKFQNQPNIILNNLGVSNNNAAAEIFYDKQGSGFASLYKRDVAAMDIKLEQRETIHLITLKNYFEEQKISHVDLLKIDIEGHELKAFEGLGAYLSPQYISALQFEYGGANLDSHTSLKEIYSLLEHAGFIIAKIKKYGLELRKYQPWMDNFQYANYVALSPKLLSP